MAKRFAVFTFGQSTADALDWRARALRLSANGLVVALWFALYRSVFDYLAIIFSREEFRTNQIILAGVIILLASQVRREHIQFRLDVALQLYFPALGVLLGGSLIYLFVERFLDINTVSASAFGLASYGLLGLWMRPQRWAQGFPAALLVIGVLPFGEHMETFIGYPMRLLTAAIVRDGLSAAGIPSIGVDTILILENGVSQIDLPCSGVKSLWTGALFLLAATWIEHRPLNARWLGIACVMAVFLFITNLARVGVLVVVGQVANQRLLAEMWHVPLGVLGFAAVCVLTVSLLRLEPAATLTERAPREPARPQWLAPFLAVTILGLALLYAPHPQTGLAQPPPTFDFPAELIARPMPLKPDEVEWLTRGGAESAYRQGFTWRGISGSMILITSTTWRAQHRPERCFEVYGLALDDSRTHLVAPDFAVRFVLLGDRRGRDRLTATYWFQSAERTTDDYGTRLWADLAPTRERWILVTILFDRVRDPNATDVRALYLALRDTVARYLKGELAP